MRHDGNRTGVLVLTPSTAIRPWRAIVAILRRVCPVEGLVYRQEMGQEVAVPVGEVIDPLHPDAFVDLCLDGKGRVTETSRVVS